MTIISNADQDRKKLEYLETVGASHTICAGNGRNDALMLEAALIGVAVLGNEGMCSACLSASDLLVKDILDVFGFLQAPERLIATLRV